MLHEQFLIELLDEVDLLMPVQQVLEVLKDLSHSPTSRHEEVLTRYSQSAREQGWRGRYIPRLDGEDLEGHVRRRAVIDEQHDAGTDLNLMDVLV